MHIIGSVTQNELRFMIEVNVKSFHGDVNAGDLETMLLM